MFQILYKSNLYHTHFNERQYTLQISNPQSFESLVMVKVKMKALHFQDVLFPKSVTNYLLHSRLTQQECLAPLPSVPSIVLDLNHVSPKLWQKGGLVGKNLFKAGQQKMRQNRLATNLAGKTKSGVRKETNKKKYKCKPGCL